MFAPTRILAPVDFSGASAAALRRALDLAGRTGAELHILHVVPGPYPDEGATFDDLSEDDQAFYHWVWKQTEGELTTFLDGIVPDGVRMKRVLTGGLPPRVVLDYADGEGIDLVVMGTHGRRGLRRLFLGSVAEEVLHRTRVPVLVVPEAKHKTFRRVLAPTDFSLASRLALPLAAEFAALYGADLDLLYAIEPLPFAEALIGTQIATDLIPDLRVEAERRLEALADDVTLAEALTGPEAPIEGGGGVLARIGYRIAEGRAAEAIVATARAREANVVVMARRGLHGTERFLLGNVTERVCRLAPCAILVVPIGTDEEPSPDAEAGVESTH